MHVAWRQEKMLAFSKEKGIHVSAWSPLEQMEYLFGAI